MNKFLMDKIISKAKWVSSHYPECVLEDVIQDGCELVMKLKKKYGPNVSVQYLLRALDNRFTNIMRNTRRAKHRAKFVDISALDWMADNKVDEEFEAIENNIDRERFLKTIQDSDLIKIIRDLELGYKPLEIATRHRTSVRKVYRQLKVIKDLREEWER